MPLLVDHIAEYQPSNKGVLIIFGGNHLYRTNHEDIQNHDEWENRESGPVSVLWVRVMDSIEHKVACYHPRVVGHP